MAPSKNHAVRPVVVFRVSLKKSTLPPVKVWSGQDQSVVCLCWPEWGWGWGHLGTSQVGNGFLQLSSFPTGDRDGSASPIVVAQEKKKKKRHLLPSVTHGKLGMSPPSPTCLDRIVISRCDRDLEEPGGEGKLREGSLTRWQSLYYGSEMFSVWKNLIFSNCILCLVASSAVVKQARQLIIQVLAGAWLSFPFFFFFLVSSSVEHLS